MKLLIILVIFSLLFCLSCEKKDKPSPILAPDFTDANWESPYEAAVSLSYEEESPGIGNINAFVWLKGTVSPDSLPTIKVNDHPCVIELTYYDIDSGGVWFSFRTQVTNFDPASILSYRLVTSRQAYEGDISLPSKSSIVFPTYVPNADFTFSWSLVHQPDAQMLYNQFTYSAADIHTYTVQLNKSKRNYTASKLLLTNAINFSTTIETVKMAENDSLLTYGSSVSWKGMDIMGKQAKLKSINTQQNTLKYLLNHKQ